MHGFDQMPILSDRNAVPGLLYLGFLKILVLLNNKMIIFL
jgi:hypothetical protein